MICTNRWFFLFSDPCRRRGPQETKRKEALHRCSQKRQTDERTIYIPRGLFSEKKSTCSRKDTLDSSFRKTKPSTVTPNVTLNTDVDTKQTKVQNTNATVSHRDSVVASAAAAASSAAAIIATVQKRTLLSFVCLLCCDQICKISSLLNDRPQTNRSSSFGKSYCQTMNCRGNGMSTSLASVFTNITHRL